MSSDKRKHDQVLTPATSSFFAKKSKSTPVDDAEHIRISVHDGSLIKGTFKSSAYKDCEVAVAGFDLDSTLTVPISKGVFMKHEEDWKWMYEITNNHLKDLGEWSLSRRAEHPLEQFLKGEQPFLVVIFTNQGGFAALDKNARYRWFKSRISKMASELGVPLRVYGAAHRPKGTSNPYRKPECGMWRALEKDLAGHNVTIDKSKSFFVGDAAGRKKDHSDADFQFAKNVGITFYTPEDFFRVGDKDEEEEEQLVVGEGSQ